MTVMEREIIARVRVTDDEHAELIRKDIISAIRKRTTIYHVSKVQLHPGKSIEASYEEDELPSQQKIIKRAEERRSKELEITGLYKPWK